MWWIIGGILWVLFALFIWSLCVAASRGDDWDQRP